MDSREINEEIIIFRSYFQKIAEIFCASSTLFLDARLNRYFKKTYYLKSSKFIHNFAMKTTDIMKVIQYHPSFISSISLESPDLSSDIDWEGLFTCIVNGLHQKCANEKPKIILCNFFAFFLINPVTMRTDNSNPPISKKRLEFMETILHTTPSNYIYNYTRHQGRKHFRHLLFFLNEQANDCFSATPANMAFRDSRSKN